MRWPFKTCQRCGRLTPKTRAALPMPGNSVPDLTNDARGFELVCRRRHGFGSCASSGVQIVIIGYSLTLMPWRASFSRTALRMNLERSESSS